MPASGVASSWAAGVGMHMRVEGGALDPPPRAVKQTAVSDPHGQEGGAMAAPVPTPAPPSSGLGRVT